MVPGEAKRSFLHQCIGTECGRYVQTVTLKNGNEVIVDFLTDDFHVCPNALRDRSRVRTRL